MSLYDCMSVKLYENERKAEACARVPCTTIGHGPLAARSADYSCTNLVIRLVTLVIRYPCVRCLPGHDGWERAGPARTGPPAITGPRWSVSSSRAHSGTTRHNHSAARHGQAEYDIP